MSSYGKIQYLNDLSESLIFVNRVSKTVKGGRTLSFCALVVVGDKNGTIGYGHGKANEISDAVKKATLKAKSSLITIKLPENKALLHDVFGKAGAGKILLKKAKKGTGIICSSSIRPLFELLGIEDIVVKSIGSNNPYNLVRASLKAINIERFK